MKIVIRAGGVGSRLWPVSRQHAPKQFHAFTGDQTMLVDAVDRVKGLVSTDDMYISTNMQSAPLVEQQCPEILQDHIIIEPERKDTAAAIGLESVIIASRDPDAIVASLGSDHSVRKVDEFQRVLRAAETFIEKYPDYIIPIGIRPTHPDSGYGYIQVGDVIDTDSVYQLLQVKRFTEKPSMEVAKQFLRESHYLWNANMFVWKVSTILDLYKIYLPKMYEQLLVIQEAIGTTREREVIEKIYPQLESIAIDYAIIEKAEKIAALSADIGWNDIGDWSRLKDELADTEADSVSINAEHVSQNSKNLLIYNGTKKKKTVVTIGVDNMIIVETDDALLICNKYQSQEVKKIVEDFEKQNKQDML